MSAGEEADELVPDDPAAVVAPRYGTRSLADVVPAVHAHLVPDDAVDAHPLVAGLTGDRVVVLVVDGLGALQLRTADDVAPLLTRLPGDPVDAVFPSTTVSSIASIGTGLPPSQHGLVGYTFPVPGHDQPLNGLNWHVGLRGGGFDARSVVVPESLQPAPTAFERAAADGVATTVVLDPDFPDSGLTRAALRGGERRTARGLDATLRTAVDAVASADGPALAYAHHPHVDWAGHLVGPGSDAWRDAVRDVDRALTALRSSLPPGVTVLVTADHGMLATPEPTWFELADHPSLEEGVEVVAGEPRVRHLRLDADADGAAVAARWRSVLQDRAHVLTRPEALHLFGPDPTPAALQHVGDLVVVARTGALVHAGVDPHGGRMPGHHGGPTAAERLVPLLRLTRGGATRG